MLTQPVAAHCHWSAEGGQQRGAKVKMFQVGFIWWHHHPWHVDLVNCSIA